MQHFSSLFYLRNSSQPKPGDGADRVLIDRLQPTGQTCEEHI